jgi:hypothetical protein
VLAWARRGAVLLGAGQDAAAAAALFRGLALGVVGPGAHPPAPACIRVILRVKFSARYRR